jgi:hypothetical protein
MTHINRTLVRHIHDPPLFVDYDYWTVVPTGEGADYRLVIAHIEPYSYALSRIVFGWSQMITVRIDETDVSLEHRAAVMEVARQRMVEAYPLSQDDARLALNFRGESHDSIRTSRGNPRV